MTEEEKKIIKRLKDDIALVTFNDNLNYGIGNLYVNINDLKIILNLISKLQTDIEIKDKETDELINFLLNYDIDEDYCKKIERQECNKIKEGHCEDCMRKYFYKKSEELK